MPAQAPTSPVAAGGDGGPALLPPARPPPPRPPQPASTSSATSAQGRSDHMASKRSRAPEARGPRKTGHPMMVTVLPVPVPVPPPPPPAVETVRVTHAVPLHERVGGPRVGVIRVRPPYGSR